jgi:hypothetical protein
MAGATSGCMIDTTAIAFVGIVVVVGSVIVLGVLRAARRAALPERDRRRLGLIAAGGIAAWLAITALLAGSGVLSDFTSKPPRLMLVVFASMALFAFTTTRPVVRRLLAAAPKHWPVAIQTMRIPIELALWALFAAGKLPVQMTFEGRNFDVLVGLTAPVVAFGIARGFIGIRGAIAWNLASFGLLLNIMGIAITTFPGPLHLDWPGVSNVIVATPPFVWLPAFLVPVAFFGHVLSLRQLLSQRGWAMTPLGADSGARERS